MKAERDEQAQLEEDVAAFVRSRGGADLRDIESGLPEVSDAPAALREFMPEDLIAGRYRIEREVGRGGQGVVYRATDLRLGRLVAVKILHPRLGGASSRHRRRFEREAQVASRLDHESLCPILDSGEHGGLLFLVMRLLTGPSLAKLISDSPRAPIVLPGVSSRDSIEGLATMFESLARGLEKAHAAGVLHRDVKPANIVVVRSSEAVLLDFGCALSDGDDMNLSVTGDVLGTIPYMAPEYLEGADAADADVYSLGVSLYECLSGIRPFDAHSREASIKAVLGSELPPIPRSCRVPRDLDVVVRTAACRERSRRYGSPGAFADDLRRFLEGRPTAARPVGPWTRGVMWARRNPVIAVALLVLSVAVVISIQSRLEAGDQRRRADAAVNARLARDLRTEVDGLWPARERTLRAMDEWMTAAKPLSAQLADILPVVRERRARAANLRHRSLEVARAEWNRCIEEVAASVPGLTPIPGLIPLGPDPRSGLQEFLHLDAHVGPIPERGADGALNITASTGVILVLLPGGETFAGAQKDDPGETDSFDEEVEERNRYEGYFRLELEPFFVSKYEFSLAQWRRVMGDDPNRFPLRSVESDPERRGLYPVEMVSWNEVAECVRRLDLRLPSEPEWEHAARGGGATVWWRGLTGEEIGNRANLADAAASMQGARWPSTSRTRSDGHPLHAPVTSLTPNGYGLHHVVGNVWEWCREWSLDYPRSPDSPRHIEESRKIFPLRGGSFESGLANSRITAREHHVARYRSHSLGFRPVLDLRPSR